MAKAKVVVMKVGDLRKPNSFTDYGSKWDDFLERWNDPNLTRDEAKGLLHTVADRLWWCKEAPERHGEDSRETCVRFLLHYADCPYRFDCEWQIVKKARQVLIFKVLNTPYIREQASDKLVMDILAHLVKHIQTDYGREDSYRRQIENFLRKINEARDNRKIRELVDKIVTILFRTKPMKKVSLLI